MARRQRRTGHDSRKNYLPRHLVKKDFLEVILRLCEPSASKQFLNKVMDEWLADEFLVHQFIRAACRQIMHPVSKPYSLDRLDTEEPGSLTDISMLEDADFWKHFHMTRRTVKHVLRCARDIAKEVDNCVDEAALRVSVDNTIAVSLWYLRNADGEISDIKKNFNLPSNEVVEVVLDRGLRIISALRAHSGITWPTNDEIAETAKTFYMQYSIENIGGAISSYRFRVNGTPIFLQVLSNQRYLFKAAEVSYDDRLRKENTVLVEHIRKVPKKYLFLADDNYDVFIQSYYNNRLLTPFENVDTNDRYNPHLRFNEVHQSAMSKVYNPLNEVLRRFPRVMSLHRTIPEAIIAACVLQNYCTLHHDEAPYYS